MVIIVRSLVLDFSRFFLIIFTNLNAINVNKMLIHDNVENTIVIVVNIMLWILDISV